MSGATQALARFASEVAMTDLPGTVVDRVLTHTLDAIGAGLVGATRSWNAVVRRYALAETPAGVCTVYGGGGRARPEWAALANATASHGFEIDDYALPALAHPGCVVVPAVLAVGEDLRVRGHEAVAALAAGFETVVRFGLASTPSLTSDRGFHVTGVHGVFGAAAAAGRLHRLDAAAMTSALGLAASQAGGVTEYTRTGGEVKRLHAGLAAMGGLRAAVLAGAGFTGPTTAIEGPRGMLRAYVERAAPDALVSELGRAWRLDGLALKRFCVCAGIQAPLRAMEELRRAGLVASDVDEIVVGLDAATGAHVGAIGARPRDMTGAQFSVQHAIAMNVVLGGNDPVHYTTVEDSGYDLPEISALADRVRVEVDPEAEAAFPHRLLARVTVRRRHGGEASARAEALGTPGAPLPAAEAEAKFLRLAGDVIGERAARTVRDAVHALRDDAPLAAVLAPVHEATKGAADGRR